MTYRNNLLLVIAAIFSLLLFSCKKENLSSKSKFGINQSDNTGMVKLIRKLNNPYSVENMRIAYDSLHKTDSRDKSGVQSINATHYYIKFKPKNHEELEILKDDSTLILYTYPLDYEISEGGYYQDPTIPDSLPTYQYASVPVYQKLPLGVEFEILENLFIPVEEDEGDPNANNPYSIRNLVQESFRLTGNVTGLKLGKKSEWRPAGKIVVWDDVIQNWRGVEGVVVRARRFFTTYTGEVNSDGNYSCNGTFKGEANYSLDWEKYHFALREGALNGASINGPKIKGDWNLSLKGDKNAFHATVFLPTFHYYHKNIDGLKRPPLNNALSPKLYIRCYTETGRAFFRKGNRFLGLGSPIKVYWKEEDSEGKVLTLNSERIFYILFHELGHASHWELRKNKWKDSETDARLKESWAMGVAWNLTRKIYPNHNDYSTFSFAQMRDPKIGNYEYTTVVIDLLDLFNQGGCCSTELPIDYISGHTIKNIEDVLKDCKGLSDLRDNLKSKYIIPNQNLLDSFFKQFIEL